MVTHLPVVGRKYDGVAAAFEVRAVQLPPSFFSSFPFLGKKTRNRFANLAAGSLMRFELASTMARWRPVESSLISCTRETGERNVDCHLAATNHTVLNGRAGTPFR